MIQAPAVVTITNTITPTHGSIAEHTSIDNKSYSITFAVPAPKTHTHQVSLLLLLENTHTTRDVPIK